MATVHEGDVIWGLVLGRRIPMGTLDAGFR